MSLRNQKVTPTNNLIYQEKFTSNKTEALFIALATIFLLLFIWHASSSLDALAVVFICLFGLFLFYSLNFRTLLIRLNSQSLKLTFGIFTWTVPLNNIADCQFDSIPR